MIQKVNINTIKSNPNNPRIIKDNKFSKLVKSIRQFPEMLELRPVVVNKDMIVLGGNMRLKASINAGLKEIPIVVADNLTEEQENEFIIKDYVGFGEWDWDVLANTWEIDKLNDWGLDVPTIKNTELLSGLKYDPVYYEPVAVPNINLNDCIDLTKYKAKVSVINNSNVSDKQKEILKMFAYRFIKIDFESVANYYHHNATEEEQKVIERLRLVITDDGIDGFIEDDLLRILNVFEFTDDND